MHRHTTLFVVAGLMTAVLHAQTPQTTPPPTTAPAGIALPPQRTPPPAGVPVVPGTIPQTVPPSPQLPPGRATFRPDSVPMQNIGVELTITDAPSTGAPAKKIVTMLVADGRMGRIRSSNSLPATPDPSNTMTRQILINVDAIPEVRTDGRILLSLTLEYVPEVAQGASKPASIHESLTVILVDRQATVISQSADPATDRKVMVEVRATVIK